MTVVESPIERAPAQTYDYYSGDHSGVPMFARYKGQEIPYGVPYSDSLEGFMDHRITQLLAADRDEPVIAMDVGAAAGVSMHRLAEKHRAEIHTGRLALVVTNMTLGRNDFAGALEPWEGDSAKLTIGKTADDVHEIFTDFTPGREYGITLANGKQVGLRNKVGLVHERLSLTAWSSDPEVRIPELASLVSLDGLYMVSALDVAYRQPRRVKRPKKQMQQIYDRMAEENDLNVVDVSRQSPSHRLQPAYALFVSPDALPVEFPKHPYAGQ